MSETKLDENDLRRLFSPSRDIKIDGRRGMPRTILKFLGLFVGLFILTYVAINITALTKIARYSFGANPQTSPPIFASENPAVSFNPNSPAKLIVPKIGATAPIAWNIPDDQIQDKLLEGVAHSQNTALPGETGNVFITGHSSYYSWSSSPYKDVFALLEKVGPNDKIYIEYPDKTFTYEVAETKVVSPDEISVLEQGAGEHLTLMTCVPVGTNLRRLVIIADRI